ncbi:subtilisin-like protease SBT4.3 [Impatiens glandulifera]|uniref:subtilisin-like protease SBT4.3 n=1 Tax=Impatiens glandulifera TaxID=253017 RepID=UPI001FB0BC68|nr:subtilisin-like protease SBT4.3 [Impatiens glandulifera]
MGFSLEISGNPTIESDIIIGHLDTGVRPNLDSLSDHGLGPVPPKWKGVCNGGKNFTCNRKLIGARFYAGESVIDDSSESHGSHTASIAVGRVAENANFYGLANGTARGGVPSARIAIYKVCDFDCQDKDVLAAYDDAIADNVDIITISVSYPHPVNISVDTNAIGSFHAMEKGILTVQAAGNTYDNMLKSVTSTAPWLFTVAGSNIDRKIISKLVLGNGRTFNSIGVNPFSTGNRKKRLVYGKEVTRHCNESSAKKCVRGCVDPYLIKGKILVCDGDDLMLSFVETTMNASGIIMRKFKGRNDTAETVLLPTALLSDHDFHYIKSYLKSKSTPSARLLKSVIIHNGDHILASFSSLGPNTKIPEILKPDITAPGLNILAESPTYNFESQNVPNAKYSIQSGTSMACPHVTGVAAYVKSKHPDWSISAIKSSIMTTARTMNMKYNTNAVFGYGAGHIDPLKAAHPGLVAFCDMNVGLDPDEIVVQENRRYTEKDLPYFISFGPKMSATTYSTYFINDYVWRAGDYGSNRSTMNSGICVHANDVDYYGLLEEIIELQYPGPCLRVVLFQCKWFDPTRGTRVNPTYILIDVNMKHRLRKYDPFVLAQQAMQVYYSNYPTPMNNPNCEWLSIFKTKARGKIEEIWKNEVKVEYQQEYPIIELYIPLDIPLYNVNDLSDPNILNVELDGSDKNESHESGSEETENVSDSYYSTNEDVEPILGEEQSGDDMF